MENIPKSEFGTIKMVYVEQINGTQRNSWYFPSLRRAESKAKELLSALKEDSQLRIGFVECLYTKRTGEILRMDENASFTDSQTSSR